MLQGFHVLLEFRGALIDLLVSRRVVDQLADRPLAGIDFAVTSDRLDAIWSTLSMAPLRRIQNSVSLLDQVAEIRWGLARMVSPFATCGAFSVPNVTSTYLSPTSPSDCMEATESFLTTLRVRFQIHFDAHLFRPASWAARCFAPSPRAAPPPVLRRPSTSPATF